MEDVNDSKAWNRRYAEGSTGWDLQAPAEALRQLLTTLPHEKKRVFVPGAGYGHDALAWAEAGFHVVAADFAPLAVAGLNVRAAQREVTLIALEADIFALPPELDASFDIVWEQTCLCAIDPARRPEYVQTMQRLLKPQGTLYALLWNHQRQGGPPHDLPRALSHALFAPLFEVVRVDTVHGSKRPGEYLMTLRKPG
jgi:methyl halide transferase